MSQTAERTSRLDEFAKLGSTASEAPTDNVPVPIEPATLAVLNRSEIDAQIAKADAKPRNIKVFRQTVSDIALLNDGIAADCRYVLPGRKKSDGSTGEEIEGPSIRFAEILAYGWTNYRVGARIIEEAYDHVTAQGVFVDIQNNGVTTFELRRRITDSRGRRYSADMVNVTANAACSIAKRNAILAAVPKALWQDIYNSACRLADGEGDAKAFPAKRDAAIAAFTKNGVAEERILARLGVERRDQIGLDELGKLRGFYTALADGEATVEEIFPAPAKPASSGLDEFASAQRSEPDAAATVGGEAPPADDAAGPAGAATKSAPADPEQLALYRMCIDKIIGAALDKKHLPDPEDRVANLDGPVKEIWMNLAVEPSFVMRALQLGVEVARGQTKETTARQTLERMVP